VTVSSVPVITAGAAGGIAGGTSGIGAGFSAGAGLLDMEEKEAVTFRREPVSRLSIHRTTVSDPPGFCESSQVGNCVEPDPGRLVVGGLDGLTPALRADSSNELSVEVFRRRSSQRATVSLPVGFKPPGVSEAPPDGFSEERPVAGRVASTGAGESVGWPPCPNRRPEAELLRRPRV
jgi:hypothetical protein